MTSLRDIVVRCRGFGQAVAVRAGEGERTYVDLVDRATRLAEYLLGLGLRPGDRVAVMVEDGIRAIEPHLAAALAGLVIVPVNARFRTAEAQHIISDSEARAIIHSSGVRDVAASAKGAGVLALLNTGGASVHDIDEAYETIVTDGAADLPRVEITA